MDKLKGIYDNDFYRERKEKSTNVFNYLWAGMVPSVRLPKNVRKFKKWNTNLTFDTIGSTISSNVSQLVNRFYPQNTGANDTKATQRQTPKDDYKIPPGVSTISGSYVSDHNSASGAQKDNFGLYALKHDRSTANNKKGLQLLHIPLKLHTKNKSGNSSNSNTLRKEINHEKFQPCEKKKGTFKIKRDQSSSLDESVGSVNDCQEVQFESESDKECRPTKPAVPPRRRKVSQSSEAPNNENIAMVPKVLPKAVEPVQTSLASFVAQNRPREEIRPTGAKLEAKLNARKGHVRNKSVDIFVKEEKDVFQDFDNIFEAKCPKEVPLAHSNYIPNVNEDRHSFSSSSPQSSSEEEKTEIRPNPERRFSSTIKVQDFNEQSIPRCKSFVSPQHHKSSSKRSSVDKAIESESSSNELKSPTIVTSTAKRIPQGILKQRTPSPKDEQPVSQETPVQQHEAPCTRKFFVYYNDEDELVFNQEYALAKQNNMISKNTAPSQPLSLFTGNTQLTQQQKLSLSDFNHNDVIYRNYYNIDQNDSLRSMASSSDGIFI